MDIMQRALKRVPCVVLVCLTGFGCQRTSRADLGKEGALAFNWFGHCFLEDCAVPPLMTTTKTSVLVQPHTKEGQRSYSFAGKASFVENSNEAIVVVTPLDCNTAGCLDLGLEALSPGVAEVRIFDADQRYVDAIDIRVVDPATIQFETQYPGQRLTERHSVTELIFKVNELIQDRPYVWALPYDEEGARLGANSGFSFEVRDPSVVSAMDCGSPCDSWRGPPGDELALKGVAVGSTELQVTAAQAVGNLPLTVIP